MVDVSCMTSEMNHVLPGRANGGVGVVGLYVRRLTAALLVGAFCACSGGGGGGSGSGAGGGGGNGGGNGGGQAPTETARWSDPTSWTSNVVPAENENVLIPAGTAMLLDVHTPSLGTLAIEGTLVADPAVDVAITATDIEVRDGGTLQIGSETAPYEKIATITLTGARGAHAARSEDNALDNDGVSRGLRVQNGGALVLQGKVPSRLKSKLNAHANAGATTFALADQVQWRAGDKIAISLTDFYGVGETEVLTLAQDTSGTSMQTTTGLATFRWGRLQYPIDTAVNGSAMSLTPGTFTPADNETPTVLDERAEVINLSRRIVVQGANDADWSSNGFGVHVMIMGTRSKAQVDGVEFIRCGQRRAMGRYPFHWHMLSYSGNGDFLGDVVGADHYLRNSAIWGSENRAVTIHGTCGVTVHNTFAVDIKGHAVFFEDGPEQRNIVTDCVAMKVRSPGSNRLKNHDNAASGFWLTNPNNEIVGNSASDCDGRGLWNSFATRCFGLSRTVSVNPNDLVMLRFDDNVGHSNRLSGIATRFEALNESGDTGDAYYQHSDTPFTMLRNVAWKNRDGGYTNRVLRPTYRSWTVADNSDIDVSGVTGPNGLLESFLFVCNSLNSQTPFAQPRRRAVASYHWQLDIRNITAINYSATTAWLAPWHAVISGGVLDTHDLYFQGISLGMFRNDGWRLINSEPGFRVPSPYFDGFPISVTAGNRHWSISGAMWDVHGYWGPAGNYLVPDFPFYTHGLTSYSPATPSGANGVTTPHVFYGLSNIAPERDSPPWGGSGTMAMRLEHLDSSNNVVGEHTIGSALTSAVFPFRHFGVSKGGRYRLALPGSPAPQNYLNCCIENAYRTTDTLLLALPWDGSVTVTGRIDSGTDNQTLSYRLANNTARQLQNTGTSLQDVINDASGQTIWQDRPSNLVWVKHVGGMALNVWGYDGRSDESLARTQQIRLRRQ